jgi:hypothetical protein
MEPGTERHDMVRAGGRSTGWLAWGLWALSMVALGVAIWLDHLLRMAGRPDLIVFDASTVPVAATHIVLSFVGLLLAVRRPGHPVGWLLLLAFGVIGNASFVVAGYADYGLLAHPGSLAGAGIVAQYFPATGTMGFSGIAFILLFTPSGSLPSPRWRWWVAVTAGVPLLMLVAVAVLPRPPDQAYQRPGSPFDLPGISGALLVAYRATFAVVLLSVAVAAVSLLARFRRARGAERQQLRWVALAAGLVALLFLAMGVLIVTGAPILPDPGVVATAAIAVLALGISAATLRYRLYDLDRIISRALSYGLLTVLLGGGYIVVVLGLGRLLDHQSSLVVAGATLAMAAVFQPARHRIQLAVDRRFNRRRYDAARTIESFSARLRQEVDLDALTVEALAVVDQTMQPTRVSLWLRPPGRTGAGAG